MTLIFKSYTWYMWGYCLKRSDYRMFKLSRIRKIDLTSNFFIHRGEKYMDPEEFIGEIVKITLKINKEFLSRAKEYFQEKNINEIDNEFFASIEFPNGEWIKEYLLSFGSNIEVLEPLWLKNSIINEAKKILNMT